MSNNISLDVVLLASSVFDQLLTQHLHTGGHFSMSEIGSILPLGLEGVTVLSQRVHVFCESAVSVT